MRRLVAVLLCVPTLAAAADGGVDAGVAGGVIEAPCGTFNPRVAIGCKSPRDIEKPVKDCDVKEDRIDQPFKLEPGGGASKEVKVSCGVNGGSAVGSFEATCTSQRSATSATVQIATKLFVERSGPCAGCAGSGGTIDATWGTQLVLPPAPGTNPYEVKINVSSQTQLKANECTLRIGTEPPVKGPPAQGYFVEHVMRMAPGVVSVQIECVKAAAIGKVGGDDCKKKQPVTKTPTYSIGVFRVPGDAGP